MIKFINEDLFSKEVEKMDGREGRPDFYRTIVRTGMNVVDKKNPKKVAPKVVEHVLHTKEDNWNEENTRVGSKFVNDHGFLRVSQKATNKFDTNVFFIAIPYNGFVTPVERSKNFTIYKGFTVTLEDPIGIGDDTYKHIAYLILVPNRIVIEDEKEACEFSITSYSSRTDGEDKKTIKVTTTIEFYNRDGDCDYEVTTKTEESDPVNFEDYAEKKIFPITLPRPKENKPKNVGGGNRKPYVKNNRPPAKKEYHKPDRRNKPKHSSGGLTQKLPKKSLEQMIRDADLDNGHVKPKRGKKGKKRR